MTNFLAQIANNKKACKPVIYGIEGKQLNDQEKYFFSQNGCVGFILFARNIEDKKQLKSLTNSLKELMDGEVLILIDQEGGRVARMRPPEWNEYPSGKYFADLYQKSPSLALEEIFNNFAKIGMDLAEVGINVNCAPLLDILNQKTHQVIGDRALGDHHKQVSELAKNVCDGLLSQKIYPVIKHIPGHGRGACDSHLELPIVYESLDELRKTDFLPFQALSKQKFAMTAHILYSSIDPNNCATLSPKAIDLIRNEIGFQNILMSDDLSMKALKGSFTERANLTIKAGCDLVLHCNGDMEEMRQINDGIGSISEKLLEKFIG